MGKGQKPRGSPCIIFNEERNYTLSCKHSPQAVFLPVPVPIPYSDGNANLNQLGAAGTTQIGENGWPQGNQVFTTHVPSHFRYIVYRKGRQPVRAKGNFGALKPCHNNEVQPLTARRYPGTTQQILAGIFYFWHEPARNHLKSVWPKRLR
jgi:hypothetical protein